MDSSGHPIPRDNLSYDEENRFRGLSSNISGMEAEKKIHSKFKDLVDSSPVDSVLIFHSFEFSKIKWGLLKTEYPEHVVKIQDYLSNFRSNLEFDFICLVDNLLAFDMEVIYL